MVTNKCKTHFLRIVTQFTPLLMDGCDSRHDTCRVEGRSRTTGYESKSHSDLKFNHSIRDGRHILLSAGHLYTIPVLFPISSTCLVFCLTDTVHMHIVCLMLLIPPSQCSPLQSTQFVFMITSPKFGIVRAVSSCLFPLIPDL